MIVFAKNALGAVDNLQNESLRELSDCSAEVPLEYKDEH